MTPPAQTQANPSEERSRSLTSMLGCGCAVLVGLFLFTVVTTTLLTYRAGKRMAEVAGDPELAAGAVREILPYDEAPAGYHPIGNLSVPWVMDVIFFGGPEPSQEGGEATQGFVFVRIRDWFGRGERSRDWLESGEGDDAPIAQEQIRFEPEETVDRGELTSGDAEVAWIARRGIVEMNVDFDEEEEADGKGRGKVEISEDGMGKNGGAHRGVLTVLSIDCGEKGWQRLGLWFAPDPQPGRPAAEVDWSGTPADPAALADHLGHFQLCA